MGLTMALPIKAQNNDSIASKHTLDNVVITGVSSPKRLSATAPVHILDKETISRLGVTDIADALHRIPGITLRDYGGAGGMKTVSVRGFGTQHTGVSYDGIALSDCQTGDIDVSRYSLENTESIALTVGDNDDIFIPARNAAYAAMLHINTITAPSKDKRPHLETQIKVGSFGYVSPFIRYRQSFNGKLALTVAGEYVYAENDYPSR